MGVGIMLPPKGATSAYLMNTRHFLLDFAFPFFPGFSC